MESSFLQHHLRNLAMFHILVFCVLFMNMVIGVILFWSGFESTKSSWFLGDVESWWMVWVYSCSIALHALCYQGAITRNKCKIQPFIVLQVIQIAGYIGWSFIKTDGDTPGLKRASMGLIHSMILQIIIGAVLVWSGFDPALKTIHLALATLIWIAAIYLISCVVQNNSRYLKA